MKIEKGNVFSRVSPHYFYLPSLLIFVLIVLYPLVSQFYFGFFEWPGFGEATFIGWNNYISVFKSVAFKMALKNNFVFFLITFSLLNLICMSIAIMLSIKVKNRLLINRGNVFFRVVFFAPVVISYLIVAVVFGFILKDNGPLNIILDFLNLDFLKQSWLGNYRLSLFSVCLVQVWKSFGYYTLIYYAGMLMIPDELYEASEIDGAGLMHKIRYIIIPMLKPSITITSILILVDSFRVFEIPYIITKGGPGNSSIVTSLLILRNILTYLKFGYGASMSSYVSIVVFAVTIIYFRFLNRNEQ